MIGEMLSLNPMVLRLALQATACLALGLVGSYLLRHRAARAHQVLFLGLVSAVALPASYLMIGRLGIGILAPPDVAPPQEAAVPWTVETMDVDALPAAIAAHTSAQTPPAEMAVPDRAEAVLIHPTRTPRVPPGRVLLACWTVTSCILFGHLLVRFVLGLRVLATSSKLTSQRLRTAITLAKTKVGIEGPVRLRYSKRVRSPIIWCWTRAPVLLVHKQAGSRDDNADWVGIFCHELAHFKRSDHISALFAELLTVVLPWHPLLWWTKRRLSRLSEDACDDWAVAHTPTSVEYAESLLKLAPERQLALLPTVVGKEKTMKARIRRIVKDKCGNPRTGKRWSLLIGMLALLATVSVALAQRRPARVERRESAEREEVQERIEREELALAGRRNVLQRMLGQLVDQAHETETTLRRRGDEIGEEGHVLRAELEALREHIEMVERQLHNINRNADRRPEANARSRLTRRQEEIEEHTRQLIRRREELAEHAHNMEMELERMDEDRPEAREKLEAELHAVHSRTQALDAELKDLSRPNRDPEPPRATPRRGSETDEPVRILNEHLREIRAEIAGAERELRRTDDREGDGAHDLKAHIDELHAHMRNTEEQLGEIKRQRVEVERERRAEAQGRRRDVQATEKEHSLESEVVELRGRVDGMHEEMVQMRELLERLLAGQEREHEVQEMIEY